MKLITAQELQSMNETEIAEFFNSMAKPEGETEGQREFRSSIQRSFDRLLAG